VAINNSDRWTQEEEERLRQLVLANTTPFEIAEALGRTVSAVKARAHSLGLTTARLGNKRRGLSKWG
jgi:DNA-directed RNA polymerase specialized sigma24 family protein